LSKEWHIASPWPDCEAAAKSWGVPPLIAQVLYNRGVSTPEAAKAFLQPQLTDLFPPETLPGGLDAAARIAEAVRGGQRIVVYGDYDVDGVTGSAILWHLLTTCGANVDLYVPHRIEEGYGINVESLDRLHADGTNLIISVDCGITAVEAAERATALGMELIITDHHHAAETMPECAHIVHPTALGDSPNPVLCGAGVAFKLAWLIAQKMSSAQKVTPEFRNFLLNAMGLAALGTVADVVPLIGENRIITRFGLAGLPSSSLLGVQALIESAGLRGAEIDSYAVGFKLGPRLNAAGRLGHARLALELMTRADSERAKEIADYLEQQNKARQTLERRILQQAREQIEQTGMADDCNRAIVLAAEGWHAGVIGIVASRIVDQYHRPAVMIAIENGEGQGSARSIHHFELHAALKACSEHLVTYGGHSMAAGLRIRAENVDAFREALIDYANNRLTPADLTPRLRIDAEINLADLKERTVYSLLNLGPFGRDNPRPRFVSRALRVVGEPRVVGKREDHLQFSVADGGVVFKAIAFGQANQRGPLRDHRTCRLAFEPIINEFRGQRTVELQVLDIQVETAAPAAAPEPSAPVDDVLPF
jgi:single-stranded-DNA-specific exonuclease